MNPGKHKSSKSSEMDGEIQLVCHKNLSSPNINCLKSHLPQAEKGAGLFKKRDLISFLKNEYSYISNYFNIIDVASLNHGKRNLGEEDDDENLQVLNIPEKKVFKKNSSKKGTVQLSSKSKAFPQTIDGIEKELEELKGTPMTYQKKLRKKGLQSRLNKKKRKEDRRQHKALLKQGKKGNTVANGHVKLIKPVLNSSGNIVSNKFDFADNEVKKESKQKPGQFGEVNTGQDSLGKKKNVNLTKSGGSSGVLGFPNSHEMLQSSTNSIKPNHSLNHGLTSIGVKKEPNNIDDTIANLNQEDKSSTVKSALLFNKDNKMVFSKVFVPEKNKKHKNKTEKDPKKLLHKLKENKKKISELEKEDKEKAASLTEKQKWSAALKRASGEKVRDDPELLKKTITKEKNKKVRSQKKWQARMDKVQKEKDDRQKKRTDNIQARKNDKKKRKMKKAIKKGSYVQV